MQRQHNHQTVIKSVADLPGMINLNSMSPEMMMVAEAFFNDTKPKPFEIGLRDSVRVGLDINGKHAEKTVYFSKQLIRYRSKKDQKICYAVVGEVLGKGAFCTAYKVEEIVKINSDGSVVCKKKSPHKFRVIKIFDSHNPILFSQQEEELLALIPSMRVKKVEVSPSRNKASLLMAYIPGDDLSALLNAHKNGSKPLSVLQRLELSVELIVALARVHQHGIIHRDIKPANIKVSDSGATILDFNLAKKKNGSVREENVGSAQFASPEVFFDGVQDEKSDLYSLGRVLWCVWGLKLDFMDNCTIQGSPITYYQHLQNLPFLFSDVPASELSKNHRSRIHDCLYSIHRHRQAERPSVVALMYLFDTIIEEYRQTLFERELDALLSDIEQLTGSEPDRVNAVTEVIVEPDQDSDDYITSPRPYSQKTPSLLFSPAASVAVPAQNDRPVNHAGCVLF